MSLHTIIDIGATVAAAANSCIWVQALWKERALLKDEEVKIRLIWVGVAALAIVGNGAIFLGIWG